MEKNLQVSGQYEQLMPFRSHLPCVIFGTLCLALLGTHVIMNGLFRLDVFSFSDVHEPKGWKCAGSTEGTSLLVLFLACKHKNYE